MHVFENPDDLGKLAKELLDLADHPRDVQTDSSYARTSLVVPDYLYERWEKYTALESSSPKEPKKSGSKK